MVSGDRGARLGWQLLTANLSPLPILALAWLRLGRELAALAAVLFLDWRIMRRGKEEP